MFQICGKSEMPLHFVHNVKVENSRELCEYNMRGVYS